MRLAARLAAVLALFRQILPKARYCAEHTDARTTYLADPSLWLTESEADQFEHALTELFVHAIGETPGDVLGWEPYQRFVESRQPSRGSEWVYYTELWIRATESALTYVSAAAGSVRAIREQRGTMAKTDVLLACVTDVEIDAIFDEASKLTGENLRERPELHYADRSYHDLGTIGGARLALVQTEMGTATVGGSSTTIPAAIRDLSPRSVIMVGIAFGVDPDKQDIGQVLIAKQIQQYEMARIGTNDGGKQTFVTRGDRASSSPRIMSRLRAAKVKMRSVDVKFGLILSGEKLVDNKDYRVQLQDWEPEALGGEMEGGGLYVAAVESGVDWALIKAVCDYADGKKRENKAERQAIAAGKAAVFALGAISRGGFSSEHAFGGGGGGVSIRAGDGGRDGSKGGDVEIRGGDGGADGADGGDVVIKGGDAT
ncbi:MAG: hypothetical protein H6719_31360 [Sandaracinaceae bacterium]|nr:hypothetical protein [Sandaracinaceae bacterium]